jgi:hypothetical protein
VRTDTQRITKYDAKTVPADVKIKVDASLPLMQSGFSSAIQSLAAIEMAIQTTLNGTPDVPTYLYPFYLSFGREIWKLEREGISGEILKIAVDSLETKWASRGLNPAYTASIRSDVFTVGITL